MTQFIDDRNEKLAGELKKLVYSDEIPVKNYRMACTGSTWKAVDEIQDQESGAG